MNTRFARKGTRLTTPPDYRRYAPRYPARERLRIFAITVVCLSGVGVVLHHTFFPWLHAICPCDTVFGVAGIDVIIFTPFAGLPLLLLLASLATLPETRRIFRSGQSPSPGRKTLRRTRLRYGRAARRIALLRLAFVCACFLFLMWGGWYAQHWTNAVHARFPQGIPCVPANP